MFGGGMWVILAPFVLAALVLVLLIGGFSQHTAAMRRSPVVTVQATCVGLWQSGRYGEYLHANFVLLDGNRLLLNCSAQQFGILSEGEVGVLTYQHDVLRSFTRATAVGRD